MLTLSQHGSRGERRAGRGGNPEHGRRSITKGAVQGKRVEACTKGRERDVVGESSLYPDRFRSSL